MHFYNKEEIDYLREITPGHSNKEITKMFNKKFNLNQTAESIRTIRLRNGIKIHSDGKFKKGHTPWNKGMKGLNIGGKQTQFKKGNIPPQYRPVGSERINRDGYTEVKIDDPNVWKQKHVLIWEKHNGPVPDGHVVIFGDGDKTNLDIDNLICVSRGQLLKLNQHRLIKNDADLTRTGVMIVDLQQKISERRND